MMISPRLSPIALVFYFFQFTAHKPYTQQRYNSCVISHRYMQLDKASPPWWKARQILHPLVNSLVNTSPPCISGLCFNIRITQYTFINQNIRVTGSFNWDVINITHYLFIIGQICQNNFISAIRNCRLDIGFVEIMHTVSIHDDI